MKTEINKLPKNQVVLTVEVTVDELKPFLAKAAAEISKEQKFAGFRPGKAPFEIVKQKVGEMAIYQQAAEFAVEKTYPRCILEHKLVSVGQPKINIEKLAPGNPLVYKATVAILPKVTLGKYKELKVARKDVEVKDEEVEKTIGQLQKMFGKEKRVSREAKVGDKVEIDFTMYRDKIPIDGGTSKNHPLIIGEGNFVPGFEDNLVGLKEGTTKEFSLKFPKEYHKKDLAGKPVEAKVSMKGVYEIELPEFNNDLAKQLGSETTAKLKEDIRSNIHKDKSGKERQRWELELLEKIIEKSTIEEIPDILLESEIHKMIHELEHEVTAQGMKFDDYLSSIKKSRKDLEVEFRPRADKRVKTALILRQISQQEEIKVTDDDIDKEIAVQKEQYKNDQQALSQINRPDFQDYLKNVLLNKKVLEFLEKENKD